MDKEEREREGGRQAAPDAELEPVDGYDNSLQKNILINK